MIAIADIYIITAGRRRGEEPFIARRTVMRAALLTLMVAALPISACSGKPAKAVRPIAAAQDVVEVGTPQMYGQWQWTVLAYSREKSLAGGGKRLLPNGVFLLVELSLTNLAIKPASFDDYVFFRVQDGQHRAYLMDRSGSDLAAAGMGLPPHGVIAFDIASDAQDLVLSEETRGEGPVRLGR
jgi:hypothetical protein